MAGQARKERTDAQLPQSRRYRQIALVGGGSMPRRAEREAFGVGLSMMAAPAEREDDRHSGGSERARRDEGGAEAEHHARRTELGEEVMGMTKPVSWRIPALDLFALEGMGAVFIGLIGLFDGAPFSVCAPAEKVRARVVFFIGRIRKLGGIATNEFHSFICFLAEFFC